MNSYKDYASTLRQIACEAISDKDEASQQALNDAIRHFESLSERDEKDASLQAIGENTARCLSHMVTALEVDYDRLEELRSMVANINVYASTDVPGYWGFDGCESDSYKTELDAKAAAIASIGENDAEELAELEKAAGDCTDREDAEQRIQEDPLSLQVRSGWHSPGETGEAEEFELLLSTGGPAVRIIGTLDEHGQADSARLQAQDWFTPWTDYRGDAISDEQLLTYCNVFYFGE